MNKNYYIALTLEGDCLVIGTGFLHRLTDVKETVENGWHGTNIVKEAYDAVYVTHTAIECKPVYLKSGLLVAIVYTPVEGKRTNCIVLSTLEERALTASTFARLFSYDSAGDCYTVDPVQFYRFHNSIVTEIEAVSENVQFLPVVFEGKIAIVVDPALKKVCKTSNWYYDDDIKELTALVNGVVSETDSYIIRHVKDMNVIDKKVHWRDSVSLSVATMIVNYAEHHALKEYYIPVFDDTEYLPVGYIRNDYSAFVDGTGNRSYHVAQPSIQYTLRQVAEKSIIDSATCKYLKCVVKVGDAA